MPVSADPSVLLIGGLLAWLFASDMLPSVAPGHVGATYWSVGILGALLFLVSLLGHELSHAVIAQRNDVGVQGITLWLFGGVAQLDGEPKRPGAEFRIAAAGPAMSIAIGLVLYGAARGLNALGGPDVWVAMLGWLGIINVLLAAFNLLPGAPLDGGRILGSILWKLRGSRPVGMAGAAKVGMGLAGLLGLAGVAELFFLRGFGGVWTILIAWFLFQAARTEGAYYQAERALGGLTVAGAMLSPVQVCSTWSSVASAVEGPFAHTAQSALPVIDATGQIRGLLTMDIVRRVPAEKWADTSIVDIMQPMDQVAVIDPAEPLTAAIEHVGAGGHALVLSGRELVGIIGPAEVKRSVEMHKAGGAARGGGPPPTPPAAPPQEWQPPVAHRS